MTFEETKTLLQNLKNAKQRVRRINEQINEMRNFDEQISIRSALNSVEGHGKGGFSSVVESIIMRIENECIKLTAALEAAFALEDKLAEAINLLDPIEQDIIIGCYMRGRMHWQLANELSYSERNINYIKVNAIKKIAEAL